MIKRITWDEWIAMSQDKFFSGIITGPSGKNTYYALNGIGFYTSKEFWQAMLKIQPEDEEEILAHILGGK